jgi:hypothetical protein
MAIRSPASIQVGSGGAGSTSYLSVLDGGITQIGFKVVPNASAGAFNGLTVTNDVLLYGGNSAIGTQNLTLSVWSGTTTGVRITPTSALIGAGGTGSTPTSAIRCSGTTVSIIGNPIVENNNILVDNAGGTPITIGAGASTSTSNVIMASSTLATTRNFTTGGNTIIGNVAGNALVVASANNTFIGDSAGSLATGSNNICIGNSSAVPTTSGNNQIAIGTASETMHIRGGFNWRVGAQITSTIDLSNAVLAQFYTVAMTAASQTIVLPNAANAAYLGARVTFKRKTNTTPFTLAAAGVGTGFVPIGSITLLSSPMAIGSTVFQVDLINDGVNWCIIGQA